MNGTDRFLIVLAVIFLWIGFVAHVTIGHAASEIRGPARVIDADTIAIGDNRIRLWGIDAPEVSTEAGRRAQAWARATWEGQDMTCAIRGRDRYQRHVATCYRFIPGMTGGVSDIAFEAVRAGHAVDWPKYSGGYYGGQ